MTNLGVGLICLAAIYLNFKLPPAYRTRPIMLIGSILATIILLAAFFGSALGLLQKF
jgi:hypothetical protein